MNSATEDRASRQQMSDETRTHRFLTIEQVADELAVSVSQIRALLKSGELRGIQVGGRHIWRIAASDVEDYITEAYRLTAARILTGELPE